MHHCQKLVRGGSSGGYTRIQKAMSAVKTSKGVPRNGAARPKVEVTYVCESRSVSPGHCQANNESLESDAMASA
ncbi:hypothetical protein FIBSPDRAFT_863004 [Athelia psychrophila]|uniref:Uncharacterized protein n=1 Tax=Athelia psychrophila TaxID=1759441 RepID=A0A166HPK9_9AGAM|nr:hypothetical protein FIBSPDRAFT_863004 [Fibularhizoctonia sp. CBS 109695]